jgi:membrane protein
MLKDQFNIVSSWLRRVLTRPQDELTLWQTRTRMGYNIARFGTRQLRQDRAGQMAAALSFRTLFGLLPVLVVTTLLIRAVAGKDSFLEYAQKLVEGLNLDDVSISSAASAGSGQSQQDLGAWLFGMIQSALDLNLTALTWVGIVVVIYAALSLMVTIEKSFNQICRAPGGRSWTRRIQAYWLVLTLSPVLLMSTLYVEGQLGVALTSTTSDSPGWIQLSRFVWDFFINSLVIFLAFKLIPNTHMRVRATIIGAMVTSFLILALKATLSVYLSNAVSFQQIYGSLGLIPLFMFWIYVMWLVILFGLQVTTTIQRIQGHDLAAIQPFEEGAAIIDPASILLIMGLIAEEFEEGSPVFVDQVSRQTGLPVKPVHQILDRLAMKGHLLRVKGKDACFSLARPPEQIAIKDLMDIGFEMVDGGRETAPVLQKFREAQLVIGAHLSLRQTMDKA